MMMNNSAPQSSTCSCDWIDDKPIACIASHDSEQEDDSHSPLHVTNTRTVAKKVAARITSLPFYRQYKKNNRDDTNEDCHANDEISGK